MPFSSVFVVGKVKAMVSSHDRVDFAIYRYSVRPSLNVIMGILGKIEIARKFSINH